MLKRKNKPKSQLFIVGFLCLIIGLLVFFSTPLKKLREEVFENMRLAIFQMQINEDNTTINNIQTENLIVIDGETDSSNNANNSPSYTYIGQLSIPSINFERGFVSKDSKYNNINYNVTIAKEADYPDVKNGNFILMAHSGNAYISFFDNLYKLEIGAKATVSYEAKTYTYQLVKTYNQPKTGKIAIYRDYTKKTLTLITCTHNDDYNQTIYIFEEI